MRHDNSWRIVACRSCGNESVIRAMGRRHVRRGKAREHEVSGLACRHRHLHRLRIAHFADDDHVWRLAERRPERGRKVGRVNPHLDLLDEGLAMRVFVFDRILDGDDVERLARVDRGDQRSKRSRLGGARLSGGEDQT